jgi:hypothetical protein
MRALPRGGFHASHVLGSDAEHIRELAYREAEDAPGLAQFAREHHGFTARCRREAIPLCPLRGNVGA